MKVYVITQGSYSDYHIVGVKLTREEAEKVVALSNDDYYDYAEIEEYDTDDIKIDTNEEIKDEYYKTYDYQTLDDSCHNAKQTVTFKDKNEVKFCPGTIIQHGAIVVTATFPHGTPTEKVEKIMRDRAAKFKAEREGL